MLEGISLRSGKKGWPVSCRYSSIQNQADSQVTIGVFETQAGHRDLASVGVNMVLGTISSQRHCEMTCNHIPHLRSYASNQCPHLVSSQYARGLP